MDIKSAFFFATSNKRLGSIIGWQGGREDRYNCVCERDESPRKAQSHRTIIRIFVMSSPMEPAGRMAKPTG
jgi:hypothetical protein